MTFEQKLFDGDQAKLVLENPAFIAAYEAIEKDLIESWKNLPATKENLDGRERLHLALTLLGKVKASLQSTLETGKLASAELEYRRSVGQRLKDWASQS